MISSTLDLHTIERPDLKETHQQLETCFFESEEKSLHEAHPNPGIPWDWLQMTAPRHQPPIYMDQAMWHVMARLSDSTNPPSAEMFLFVSCFSGDADFRRPFLRCQAFKAATRAWRRGIRSPFHQIQQRSTKLNVH